MAKKDWTRVGPLQVVGSLALVLVGFYTGVWGMLLEVVFVLCVWYALSQISSSKREPATPTVAIQLVQIVWFCLALAQPATARTVWLDIVVLTGLTLWLYLSMNRAAAWSLAGFQALSIAVTAPLLIHAPVGSAVSRGLVMAMAWRIAVIIFALSIHRPQADERRLRPSQMAKVFE